jgi:cell division protein FtsZ
MGAKKILLSIISGVEAELQMDELSEITEYIQEQAGEEAEMIFGHGVDPDLGDRIRVTVIATGFQSESKIAVKKQDDVKKVHDLDRSQGWLFNGADTSINEKKDLELKTRPEPTQDKGGDKPQEREVTFSGPFNKIEQPSSRINEDEDDALFKDDDFDVNSVQYGDQVINDDGMMELRTTKHRLQQHARERHEKIKQARKSEMTKEEFNEKWALPAYLRRGVKMQDVPHSSEPFISKYNLNDDNNILGNNKFLHDNVD